ncbi:MAG: SsrA-binding protein [Candidatus Amesbacteria bacterium GW2011_GWC1_46_24]|nr:MAG: SsrA-binding protein [Candidatus Amesbacteria bacterium GW2011_GWC1_46_24]
MRIFNKKARFNYDIEAGSHTEAGISLSGGEAKSVREKHADISDSQIRILSEEAFLINANIPVLGAKLDPTRSRKLLLHKNELLSIATKVKQKKLVILPVSLYNKGRLIKLELALGKPKKQFEKREEIKRRDINREIEKEFKTAI